MNQTPINTTNDIWKESPVNLSKLIEWREIMVMHGHHHRAHEIQHVINHIKNKQ